MPPPKKKPARKKVTAHTHPEAKRKNIPNAEHESVLPDEDREVKTLRYQRNPDLDPQLVWRGKDAQDETDLNVPAPPIYIQEKVHPKVLIDDLMDLTKTAEAAAQEEQLDLFGDFNGIPDGVDKTDFYAHDQNWSNRMILGDSLQVMASLAEREGLRGKVQAIYFDPPYGIKFNSNFQWSTTSRDVKDGKAEHITREPEMVKAFRDTWRHGIHSYLTYLRDRLTVARDLLTDSGSIFVQIGDENVHRVRCLMDEVFGEENFVSQITVRKTTSEGNTLLGATCDFILWFGKSRVTTKFRPQFSTRSDESDERYSLEYFDGSLFRSDNITSSRPAGDGDITEFHCLGHQHSPGKGTFKTTGPGLYRLKKADRFIVSSKGKLNYRRSKTDFGYGAMGNLWSDISGAVQSRSDPKVYVVQSSTSIVTRCLLMATDPGDLVLDPTCGSGTTATVAEQWGRRWITIDTSRVALALARARIMGARYPYYLLADSKEGQEKEAELSGKWKVNSGEPFQPLAASYQSLRMGFVYERVPHITLKSIANNAEIDIIWKTYEKQLAPLRELITEQLPEGWLDDYRSRQNYDVEVPPEIQEWEVPRHPETAWPEACAKAHASIQKQLAKDKPNQALIKRNLDLINDTLGRDYILITDHSPWATGLPDRPADLWTQNGEHLELFCLHEEFWKLRIARQQEIDASIAAKADHEYLYDKPYENKKAVRVAGPFTVESLSPHRTLALNENDEFVESTKVSETAPEYATQTYEHLILDNLKTAGVQQVHKEDRINFDALEIWPGRQVCAVGTYRKGDEADAPTKRAGICIGPEFGSLRRADLIEAATEAGDAQLDTLIACAFSYEATATGLEKHGRIPILKARMNADLHMADDLKKTDTANLFVVFGEPDIVVGSEEWLVDSFNQPIAPYEIIKLLSGTKSLAEINGLERENLSRYADLSRRREVWDYLADEAGKLFDSGQYCRGAGPEHNRGISTLAWNSARLPGGVGDVCDALCEAGISDSKGFRELVDGLRGSGKNAHGAHQIPAGQKLTTTPYSQVSIRGIDVFDPRQGEVRSDNTDGIACWMLDTNYNGESFFVRHAYFLGQNDPYKSLKTTLKAEINREAWETLNSATSRPFEKPATGRIAVKAINHLGDEVMKIFRI